MSGLTGPKKTIQEAIDTVSSGGTIYVANGIYKEHLKISKNVNLIGQSQKGTIIDGSATGRPVTINTNIKLTIKQFTIQHGKANRGENGGGILNLGYLTIINSKIQYNTAEDGGGICSYNSNVLIKNCIIHKNKALHTGGGIQTLWGSMTITQSTIQYNIAKGKFGEGGGINNNGKLTITNSKIQYNKAKSGGGISNSGPLVIKNCKIYKNTAKQFGGGIQTYVLRNKEAPGRLTITNSEILYNKAKYGGGINCLSGKAFMKNSIIIGNNRYAIHIEKGGLVASKVTAKYNWWGSKSPKFSSIIKGKVKYKPWLKTKPV